MKKPPRSMLRSIQHLLPQTLLDKTSLCKHNHGCFENVIRDALQNFLFGFGLNMLFKHLAMVAKPAKLMKSL